jgi:hypothetical protein
MSFFPSKVTLDRSALCPTFGQQEKDTDNVVPLSYNGVSLSYYGVPLSWQCCDVVLTKSCPCLDNVVPLLWQSRALIIQCCAFCIDNVVLLSSKCRAIVSTMSSLCFKMLCPFGANVVPLIWQCRALLYTMMCHCLHNVVPLSWQARAFVLTIMCQCLNCPIVRWTILSMSNLFCNLWPDNRSIQYSTVWCLLAPCPHRTLAGTALMWPTSAWVPTSYTAAKETMMTREGTLTFWTLSQRKEAVHQSSYMKLGP